MGVYTVGQRVGGYMWRHGGWGGIWGARGGEKRNDTLTRGHDAAAMTCANATN